MLPDRRLRHRPPRVVLLNQWDDILKRDLVLQPLIDIRTLDGLLQNAIVVVRKVGAKNQPVAPQLVCSLLEIPLRALAIGILDDLKSKIIKRR